MEIHNMDENLKIKLGQFVRVENKNKKNLENDIYVALQIEDEDGNNERCILFTEIEIADLKCINLSNWFVPSMVAGRLYNVSLNKNSFYLMKIFNRSEDIRVIKLSKRLLKKAEKRAKNNPEDLTKKSYLTDLFD